jgi:sodium-coupled neutral amino acid transporter 7/8
MADVRLFHFDLTALYSLSIVVFGFNCHANLVGVFYELEHYPHRLVSRLPARCVEAACLPDAERRGGPVAATL